MTGDDARLDWRQVAFDDVEIGAADTTGDDLEEHGSGLRLRLRISSMKSQPPGVLDRESKIAALIANPPITNFLLDGPGHRRSPVRNQQKAGDARYRQSSHAMALRVAIAGDWAMPANSLPCFVAPPFDPFPLVSSGGSAAASSDGELSIRQVLCGLQDALRAAKIAPIIFIGAKGEDLFPLGRETQIGVNDRKGAFFVHLRKDTRRNDMDAGKGQGLQLGAGRTTSAFPSRPGAAAAEPAMLVKEQIARSLAVLNRQRGEGVRVPRETASCAPDRWC